VVGDIEFTGMFRPLIVDESAPTGEEVLLSDAASNMHAKYKRVGPGDHDEKLLEMTGGD
jgi:hypothetical protein